MIIITRYYILIHVLSSTRRSSDFNTIEAKSKSDLCFGGGSAWSLLV